jgi:hypothetical protein
MSCRAAYTLKEDFRPHLETISFTAAGSETDDGDTERIDGRWWVCGGRMGYYFCGDRYRPARVPGLGGGTTFKGPFTEEVVWAPMPLTGRAVVGQRSRVL